MADWSLPDTLFARPALLLLAGAVLLALLALSQLFACRRRLRERRRGAALLRVLWLLVALLLALALAGLGTGLLGYGRILADAPVARLSVLTCGALPVNAPEGVERAKASGLPARSRLWGVELPLASPAFLAGIGVNVADLSLIDTVRQQWAFYRDRRPDAYGPLVQQ